MTGPGITKSRHSEERARDELDELLERDARINDRETARRKAEHQEAGEALKLARIEARWSIRKLAFALGCARQTLMNWEEAGAVHHVPSWVWRRLPKVAPDVAKELLRADYRLVKEAS